MTASYYFLEAGYMSTQSNKLSLIEQSQYNESIEEIKQTLRGLVDANEITLRDISKIAGFAPPTISQALNNKYEGDRDRLDEALARYYRSWIVSNAIVDNSVTKKIHATMMLAWKRKEICTIIAPYGRGKSKSSARFVALNSDFAVYVELTSTTRPASLLRRVAEALNIEGQMQGSVDDRLSTIIRALQRTPRQLVIDEADELDPKTLAILRYIHGGEMNERCSIVLIGTDKLEKLLRDPLLGYVRRRIRMQCKIGDISFDEAKKIADLWPHKLDRDELKEAWAWSLHRFGIATMVGLMVRAYDEMQGFEKKKIDSECLAIAYGWLEPDGTK